MVQLEVTSAESEQEVHVGYIYIERTGERHTVDACRREPESIPPALRQTAQCILRSTASAKALSLVVGV